MNIENEIRYFLLDFSEEEMKATVFLANIDFAKAALNEIMDKVIILAEDIERIYDNLYVTGITKDNIRDFVIGSIIEKPMCLEN